MTTLVFDLETNGLLPELDRIHCISMAEPDQAEPDLFDPEGVGDGLQLLQQADRLVGHNIQSFDIRAIQKVRPGWAHQAEIYDTMVASRLMFPDLKERDFAAAAKRKGRWIPRQLYGSHSLAAWGQRLGVLKGDFGDTTDWEEYTPGMGLYCVRDVEVTQALYARLQREQWPDLSVRLEHGVAAVLDKYMDRGVFMHKENLNELSRFLQSEIGRLDVAILEEVGKLLPSLEDFEEKTWSRRGAVVGLAEKTGAARVPCLPIHYMTPKGKVPKVKPEPFSPSSRVHCGRVLVEYCGWKPTKFGAHGHPSLDGDTLEGVDHPLAALISERFSVDKRVGQVISGPQAWQKKIKPDGRIYHRIIHNGTITGRAAHSGPNLGQVPRVGNPQGAECRRCFTIPDGYKMVGCDASGLQMRALAHYQTPFDGGALTRELLEGDTHDELRKRIAKVVPEGTRDQAKTYRYASLFGAYHSKLGSIYGGGAKLGKQIESAVLAEDKGLAKLKAAIDHQMEEHGFIRGLDGRPLRPRKPNAYLNTLLMAFEALVMKVAVIIMDRWIVREGLDAHGVLQVHDEYSFEVREDQAERVAYLAERAIVFAGRYWKTRCPLEGQPKVGLTWEDVH